MSAKKNQIILIKNKLVGFLKTIPKNIENIVSITFVGSFAEGNKNPAVVNDFDIVFVYSLLNYNNYKALLDTLNSFCEQNSTDDVGIIVENRIGPFKTKSNKPTTIQIHTLIFDVSNFRKVVSNIVAYDWQRFKPIFGKSLEEIIGIQNLTKEDILNNRGGIDYFINQIETHEQIKLEIDIDKNGRVNYKKSKFILNSSQITEACYKGIISNLENFYKLKYKINTKPSYQEIEKLIKEFLSNNQIKDIKLLRKFYESTISNKEHTPKELELLKKKSKDILLTLRKNLFEAAWNQSKEIKASNLK